MESKEKCEQIIGKFNGKYLHSVSGGCGKREIIYRVLLEMFL